MAKQKQKRSRKTKKAGISLLPEKWVMLALAGLCFLLYTNTLGHEYALDDAIVISDNQLVQKGYVKKIKGEPTAERGGRSKIYYHITPVGKKALQETRQLHQTIWDGIPDLVVE